MTQSQRSATIAMMDAILACGCAPADIRFRAEGLRARLTFDFSRIRFGQLFAL